MRIACLYFPTSSVGGIATNVAALREEAQRRGDTFHVLVCANASTHRNETFKTKTIRGGDTYITVDGYAPHTLSRAAATAKRLNQDYDLVYLAFLCPHPTKSYGDDPVFLDLLQRIKLPMVGRIADGYYETYKEWGDATADLCKRMIIAIPQYTPEGFAERHPNLPVVHGRPFDPVGHGWTPQGDFLTRSTERSLAWVSQWKAIKGIHRFLPLLPSVSGSQDLYSNGILYYQLRYEPEWSAAVGEDRFKPEFSGKGRAVFHGWQPLPVIREALKKAWFMPEFQGLGQVRHPAYANGSTNNTMMEALYYGCTPVIPAKTIVGCGLPAEACIGVSSFDDIIPALNGSRASRPDLGKQWVLDNFHVSTVYDRFFGGLV